MSKEVTKFVIFNGEKYYSKGIVERNLIFSSRAKEFNSVKSALGTLKRIIRDNENDQYLHDSAKERLKLSIENCKIIPVQIDFENAISVKELLYSN